jgi:hypothetical protein
MRRINLKAFSFFRWIYILFFYCFLGNMIIFGPDRLLLNFQISSFVITPRIILGSILMFLFLISFIINPSARSIYPNSIFYFLLILFLYILAVFLHGIVSYGFSTAFSDFKSLFWWILVLPIFDLVFNYRLNKKMILYIFLTCATIVSIFCLIFAAFLYFHNVSLYDINYYMVTNFPKSGFGFRSNHGVYYSGLFFSVLSVPILAILLFSYSTRKNRLLYGSLFAINLAGVLQSSTRGFLLLLAFSSFFVILFLSQKKKKNYQMGIVQRPSRNKLILWVFSGVTLFAALCFLFLNGSFSRLIGGDTSSDATRLVFFQESIPSLMEFPFFFGKGFGFTVPSKNGSHLEVSLLEIWLKEGFLGLLLWLVPLYLSFFSLKTTLSADYMFILLVTVQSVYFVSLFNPYLTSVQGILCILICLAIISQEQQTLVFFRRGEKE